MLLDASIDYGGNGFRKRGSRKWNQIQEPMVKLPIRETYTMIGNCPMPLMSKGQLWWKMNGNTSQPFRHPAMQPNTPLPSPP